jgi:hypothetical protein
LKGRISDYHDREIEVAIRDFVGEIYRDHSSNPSMLNYNEWKDWILEQRGVTDLLSFQ